MKSDKQRAFSKDFTNRFEENSLVGMKAAKKGVGLILLLWFVILCIISSLAVGFLYLIKIWFITNGC